MADAAADPPPPHRWAWLERLWWRPERPALVQLLRPLAWLYRGLALLHRLPYSVGLRRAAVLPVPVIVVGNLIVGGAGKTPAVLALVRALRLAGREPGVISRGYGSAAPAAREVLPGDAAAAVGDEPWLIRRNTAVPVFIGADRPAAARALLAAHPGVDVIVTDDGLQHHALARDLQLIVFDARGAGNGLLLPAGPLREPLPRSVPAGSRVLYNAQRASTALPGAVMRTSIASAVPLASWQMGHRQGAVPIAGLRGPPILAAAGIADPERYFRMLDAAGLTIKRLPLPDHHRYASLPWPAGTGEVVLTEKDAAKLVGRDTGSTKVWVVALDSTLPDALVDDIVARLPPKKTS